MRESFGGAFTINLVLVFIVVYVSFMAVAVNYAKTFRVKNRVIDILEQNQYDGSNSDLIGEIDTYLGNVPYLVKNEAIRNSCLNDSSGIDKSLNVFTTNGVCIVPQGDSDEDRYYKVVAYICIEFPFFKLKLDIPISGETQVIPV